MHIIILISRLLIKEVANIMKYAPIIELYYKLGTVAFLTVHFQSTLRKN